jgi:hypothetical protein
MSIRQNFPTTPPSLVLDFANSKTLDPRITFSRTNPTATRMNELGLIETVGADIPRFDHEYDASTGSIKCLGLLVEEQRSNLLTYSEDWSLYHFKQSLDITTNDITSPDGAETADKLQCNASGLINDGFIQKLQTFTANTKTYTTSWFVKRGNTDRTNLSTALSGGTYLAVYAYIDWTSSPVSFNYDGNNGSPVYTVHPSLEEYPNGWYRASISITNNNTNTQITNRIYASSRSSTVSGDYVYAWGSQAEEGSFPTSYIPRPDASTATRNPDSVTMTGDNFSDWYNQSEGTIYVSQKLKSIDTVDRNSLVYLINGGSGSDIFYNVKGGDTNIFVFGDDGTNYSRWQENGDSTDTKAIWAYDVSGDDFKPYWNGIEGVNESNSSSPSATSHTQLEIGATVGAKYNGHISKLSYYPTRLSNDQLQNLTK